MVSQTTTSFRKRQRGFALVVVLMMMVMLTLIALSLLSLANISLRQGTAGSAQSVAKANARMALQMAIASLQKNLGPDGRVSASAEIFDTDPSTTEIEGVKQPHWTGAWLASKPNGTGGMSTPLTRDDSDGGLRDARATGGWPRGTALDWLVSWPATGTTPDPRTAQQDPTWTRLVSTGNTADDVWVPTIPVSTTTPGRFAWWVGDEGTKAKINIPDAYTGKPPTLANAATGGYYHWLAAQTNDPAVVDAAFGTAEDRKSRLLTAATQPLATTATRQAAAARFHDFTTYSLGLPVDVPDGRLKRDLTAYFLSSGGIADLTASGKVVSPGIFDTDAMVGPANAAAATREGLAFTSTLHQNSAPRFGLLRKWSLYSPSYPMAGATGAPKPPVTTAIASGGTADQAYDTTNKNIAAISPLDTPSINPVLVEGSLYYQLVAENTPGDTVTPWHLIAHIYPRVVLWNPYNVTMQVPVTSLMLQLNGMKQYMVNVNGSDVQRRFNWAPNGVLNGTFAFELAAVNLSPGACAVFSPVTRAIYRPVPTAAAASPTFQPNLNQLSPTVAPSPNRGFTIDLSAVDATAKYATAPKSFRENYTGGDQADDYRMIWKTGSASSQSAFSALPQISGVSCAIQFGRYDERGLSWSTAKPPVPIQAVAAGGGYSVDNPPDTRTRDGFRMRWLRETADNKAGAGSLANTNLFDTALIGNWNPRASYSIRTPYDNLSDVVPAFFGNYTRDLFDDATSFTNLTPFPKDGLQQTWPFGPPGESPGPVVLFDVPRKETGVVSLAQMQHAKLSEFSWHPSYAVGNSLADPRLEDRTDRTAPVAKSSAEKTYNGWTKAMIGHRDDDDTDYWAFYARGWLNDLPITDAVVYDLSYELNRTLWDDFFLSTGTVAQKQTFATGTAPLPNGRMRLTRTTGTTSAITSDLVNFQKAASRLGIDGAFNVNSTSVAAWKTVLAGTRGSGTSAGSTIFPRLLNAPGGEYKDGSGVSRPEAWNGSRVLDDAALDALAQAIVVQVKKRGPFLSLSDFVNRRLALDETGKAGALEAAIQSAGLNKSFSDASGYPLDQSAIKDCKNALATLADSTRMDTRLMPPSTAWGAPGYLTQADILQPLGPQLAARSDTFVIRSYGDCRSSTGTVEARAWCEAVVQRLPDPLTPDATGINPINPGSATDFGRRFTVISFRWLNPSEI